jgi:hypothetical protein
MTPLDVLTLAGLVIAVLFSAVLAALALQSADDAHDRIDELEDDLAKGRVVEASADVEWTGTRPPLGVMPFDAVYPGPVEPGANCTCGRAHSDEFSYRAQPEDRSVVPW